MRLLIDPAALAHFQLRQQSAEHGDLRRYYCAVAPWRVLVVCRNGLALIDLAGQTVDAALGHENAWREFAREGNANQRHTKITLYRRLAPAAKPEDTLSQVVGQSPRDPE
jgi:hypothetical protein